MQGVYCDDLWSNLVVGLEVKVAYRTIFEKKITRGGSKTSFLREYLGKARTHPNDVISLIPPHNSTMANSLMGIRSLYDQYYGNYDPLKQKMGL